MTQLPPATDATDAAPPPPAQKVKSRPVWREMPLLVIVSIGLALLLRTFVVQAFYIPSGSMEATLHGCEGCSNNDRVVVFKLGYRFGEPRRGDIVVFDGRGSFTRAGQRKDFVKRVIGVGGDTISCCDADGRLLRNGEPVDEPYLRDATQELFEEVTVPDGQLWLMGDNRNFSDDSRTHGPVPVDRVVGEAFIRMWPPSRIGPL
jgi:signal peptidase I